MNKQEGASVEDLLCDRHPGKTVHEEGEDDEEFSHPIPWRNIEAEGLDCDYGLLFSKEHADGLFLKLEQEVEYFSGTYGQRFECHVLHIATSSAVTSCHVSGEETKVWVFGKMHNVPRKQATYGDEGLTYSFSGVHLKARVWTPTVEYIRDAVTNATGQSFNFVLINRSDLSMILFSFWFLRGVSLGHDGY